MTTAKLETVNVTCVVTFLESNTRDLHFDSATGFFFWLGFFHTYITFIITCSKLETSCERGFTRLDLITAESELNTDAASLHVNSAHIFKLLSLYRRMRVGNRIEHGGVGRERDIMP